jgi:hypothetical protein
MFSLLIACLVLSLVNSNFVELFKLTVPPDDNYMLLYSWFYFSFDLVVNKSTREVDLFVPQPLQNCVLKFSGLKEGSVAPRGEVFFDQIQPLGPDGFDFRRVLVFGDELIALDIKTGLLHFSNPKSSLFSQMHLDTTSLVQILAINSDSLLVTQPGLKNVVLIRKGSSEPEVIFQYDVADPNSTNPIIVNFGPSNDQIVLISSKKPVITLRNFKDHSVPDVDLADLFERVVPAQIGLDVQGWTVFDIRYDTAFPNLNVAVVGYCSRENYDLGLGQKMKVRYAVFFCFKSNPDSWSLLKSLDFSVSEHGYTHSEGFAVSHPLTSLPVVKDGVLMVSLVDKVQQSLSFFMFDYYEDLMVINDNILVICAVLKDWKGLNRDMSKVFDVILQNSINSSINPDMVFKMCKPESVQYKKTKGSLKSVILKGKTETEVNVRS